MRRLAITLLMTCLLCLVPVATATAQPPSPFEYLVAVSLLLLFTVTIGALIGFGIGSVVRRDEQPITTEHQAPGMSGC